MPDRPDTVPADAVLAENPWAFCEQWSTGDHNDAGKRVGRWRWWSADGALDTEAMLSDDGTLESLKHFHPNGELAMASDRATGTEVCIRSTDPAHRPRGRGLYDAKAWRAERVPGSMPVHFRLYDRDGTHLNPVLEPSVLPCSEPDVDEAAIRAHLLATSEVVADPTTEGVMARLRARLGPLGRMARLLESYLEDIEDGGDVLWHDGDLEVDALLDWDALGVQVLVVDGDLTVRAGLRTSDDLQDVLVVTGDLLVGDVETTGVLVVGGDLRVRRCLFGDYNHGMAHVRGDLSAHFFFPGDHTVVVGGTPSFRVAFGDATRLDPTADAAMTYNAEPTRAFLALLHPEVREHVDTTVGRLLSKPCPDGVWEYVDLRSFTERALCGDVLFADETGAG